MSSGPARRLRNGVGLDFLGAVWHGGIQEIPRPLIRSLGVSIQATGVSLNWRDLGHALNPRQLRCGGFCMPPDSRHPQPHTTALDAGCEA